MPAKIYVKVVGAEKLAANFKRLRIATREGIVNSLVTEAEVILAKAVENAPMVTGKLRESGRVEFDGITPTAARARVVFGSAEVPYAASIHENPRAGRTGGVSPSGRKYAQWSTVGGWKYLQHAMWSTVHGRAARIGSMIQRHWRTSLGR